MNPSTTETIYFRYCRSLDGRLVSVDTARHNGRAVPRFPRYITEFIDPLPEETPDFLELVEEVCYNLTPIERSTWLRILDGQCLLAIAEQDHVSHVAIYERIRGNSKGHGGMISKNDYVRHWWKRRNGKHKPQ